jgi:hypothetical protein
MESVSLSAAEVRSFDLPLSLDKLFEGLTAFFLFITVFLPSGSVYGLDIKAPLYLMLLPLTAYTMFKRTKVTRHDLVFLAIIPAVLSLWMILGVVHGFPFASSLRQFADLLLTLILCWITTVFCGEDYRRRIRFLHIVLNAELGACLLKFAVLAYAVANGIPTVQVVEQLSKIFGVNLMTMDLGAMFGRVQFVSDSLIPVCIFLVLRHRRALQLGNLRASITLLMLVVSVIFSFSRYFWGFSVLAFALGLLLGERDRFQLTAFTLLTLASLVSLPLLITLYQLRFSNDVSGNSDSFRVEQTQALDEFFKDAPLLGHGLGSYTNQVLRAQDDAPNSRYSYEAQLLALTGQVGILGVTLLGLLTAFYFRDLWWKTRSPLKERAAIAAMLAFWIAAGLYNPLLFNPIAGVVYSAFAVLASIAKQPLRI